MAAAIVEELQTTFYVRVPCDLPRISIWLPTTKNDACAGEEELEAAEDSNAPTSIFKRVVSASRNAIPSMRRTNLSKVSPSLTESLISKKSAKTSGVQLTALEKQYLNYVRRCVGTGEFAHYLVPAP